MRTLLLATVMLGAMAVQVNAQTTTPAMGSKEVYWVVTFKVDPSHAEATNAILDRIVAATAKEPGIIEYEYSYAPDRKTVESVERFRDADAVMVHLNKTFPPLAKEFLAELKPVGFVVFGAPNDAVKKAIAGFNPVYMTPGPGFTK